MYCKALVGPVLEVRCFELEVICFNNRSGGRSKLKPSPGSRDLAHPLPLPWDKSVGHHLDDFDRAANAQRHGKLSTQGSKPQCPAFSCKQAIFQALA